MNKRGDKADITLREDKMFRAVIVYNTGVHVLREFADRGINLDGTFMKYEDGGVLLVASCKNSNNEIQIVAKRQHSPSPTVTRVSFRRCMVKQVTSSLFCVRHMLENFNAKFRNATLKDQAWNMDKSLTVVSFERLANKIQWAAAYTIRPRFGTMITNNVESVEAREKPLLDCLMAVETYATKVLERKRYVSVVDMIEIVPSCLSFFVVKVRMDGELPVEYSLDLDNPENPCSRGYFGDMKRPCSHLYVALRSVNKLSLLNTFCDASWTKEVYQRAYDPMFKMSPCVTVDELTSLEKHQPLTVSKKRGVGKILHRYTSGKLLKAFQVIPSLSYWDDILWLTKPSKWSPHSMYAISRIFPSNLSPEMAERFYNIFLLEHVRQDIRDNKRLNLHLYMALKKALYKPQAFFKGVILLLCESPDCTLCEVTIIGSVMTEVSVPVIHSAKMELEKTRKKN
ncbi:unnamed protein product [Albugo candida]|uniref:SWIM-type domain-containing protein n=1 Tax=Albugo candida TaxID=65357 RepID=A0A024GPU5_9STRA|nr:unnamed protein product [Albugo candida]|eukprot:CCI48369.1 unnamed protein product [Albugo candida]